MPVYGPPEWFEGPEEVIEPDPEFDPEDNIPVTVYGPPEWFEGSPEDPETAAEPEAQE